jgi:hypothetical protein
MNYDLEVCTEVIAAQFKAIGHVPLNELYLSDGCAGNTKFCYLWQCLRKSWISFSYIDMFATDPHTVNT